MKIPFGSEFNCKNTGSMGAAPSQILLYGDGLIFVMVSSNVARARSDSYYIDQEKKN